jgi:hypothetical protein
MAQATRLSWVLLLVSTLLFMIGIMVGVIHKERGYEARRVKCVEVYDGELIYARGVYRCFRKHSEILL